MDTHTTLGRKDTWALPSLPSGRNSRREKPCLKGEWRVHAHRGLSWFSEEEDGMGPGGAETAKLKSEGASATEQGTHSIRPAFPAHGSGTLGLWGGGITGRELGKVMAFQLVFVQCQSPPALYPRQAGAAAAPQVQSQGPPAAEGVEELGTRLPFFPATPAGHGADPSAPAPKKPSDPLAVKTRAPRRPGLRGTRRTREEATGKLCPFPEGRKGLGTRRGRRGPG